MPFLGLPPDGNIEEMKQVWNHAQSLSPKPMTILSALFRGMDDVDKLDLRLRISKEEKTLGLFLVKQRRDLVKGQDDDDDHLRPYTDFIIDVSGTSVLTSVSSFEQTETMFGRL